MLDKGFLTVGRWRGVPIRVHWSVPIGAFVFGRFEFVPAFWLGVGLLIVIHEIGHAYLVLRFRQRMLSIDMHGLGGLCAWSGKATEFQRSAIAWGGVLAQGLVLVGALAYSQLVGPPASIIEAQLRAVFVSTNLWMIGLNLLPFRPLDGAEAWRMIGILRTMLPGYRGRPASNRKRRKAERRAHEELARIDKLGEPDEETKRAVDEELERAVKLPMKPRDTE